MRKTLSSILLLMLAVSVCLTAQAENPMKTAEAMTFFSGVAGRVAFALPGVPEMVSEMDVPDYFTDSRQLMGSCVEDGTEYQLRSGDIREMIDGVREEMTAQWPDVEEDIVRLNALMNYCFMFPRTYGAELQQTDPHGDRETGWLWIDYTFTYPDAPGVTYYGKAMLADTWATGLVIEECPHAQEVLGRLRFLTDEELEAEKAAMEQETVLPFHGLEITFPREPVTYEINGAELAAAFSADWSYLSVQYQAASLVLNLEGEALQAKLVEIARERMLVPFKTKQVNDPAMSFPAEGIAQLDFTSVNESTLGQYGQPMRCRLYAGEKGVWYVYAADTDTGRAFLDALRFTDGERIQPAKTFPQFRANLEKLLPEGSLVWADAICSDGEWVRVGINPETDLGGILAYVDSSAEDAAVREVRVLQMDGMSGETLLVAGKCARALSGEAVTLAAPTPEEAVQTAGGVQVSVQHFDPADSTLVYDRVRLVPAEVPEKREEIRYPEDENVAPFENGPTAAEFEARLARLKPRVLPDEIPVQFVTESSSANGPARGYLVGNSTMLLLYLDGEGEDARINLAVIVDLGENAPQVVGTTLLTFAILTDASDEDCAAMSYILLETPMWDQLADRWPYLCRGNLCAHLQEGGDEENWQPMGFIAGRP